MSVEECVGVLPEFLCRLDADGAPACHCRTCSQLSLSVHVELAEAHTTLSVLQLRTGWVQLDNFSRHCKCKVQKLVFMIPMQCLIQHLRRTDACASQGSVDHRSYRRIAGPAREERLMWHTVVHIGALLPALQGGLLLRGRDAVLLAHLRIHPPACHHRADIAC